MRFWWDAVGMRFFKGKEGSAEDLDVIIESETGDVVPAEQDEPKRFLHRLAGFFKGVAKKMVKGVTIAIVFGVVIGLGVGIGGQVTGTDPDVTMLIGAAIGYVSGIFVGIYVLISIIREGRKLRRPKVQAELVSKS